jgi:eukaryotic-like serine/threonine-protein kinase
MEPGTELDGGKYRIVRQLGRGGMGAVYEAVNVHTRKRVAIKCLLPSLALSSPSATERLVREAEASCRVRHPNVVDVYDIVRDGPSVFLIMEYLEGETLSAAIERGDLPLHGLVALLLPAMRAVAAAHAQGVVHRDIKPDNIFLARQTDVVEPVPKVLDFGISKLDARGTQRAALTHAGAIMGTPMYMSYEQLLGVPDIDGRADVYAFGVTLYEALTGRLPFEARTHLEWLHRLTQPAPPPSAYWPEIPESLERLVMACLASDRDKRTPNMEALIRALTPFAAAPSTRDALCRPRWSTGMLSSQHTAHTGDERRSDAARMHAERTSAALRAVRDSARLSRSSERRSASVPVRAAAAAHGGGPRSETASGALGPRRLLRILAAVSVIAALLGAVSWWLGGSQSVDGRTETKLQAATLSPPPQPSAAHSGALSASEQHAVDALPQATPSEPTQVTHVRDETVSSPALAADQAAPVRARLVGVANPPQPVKPKPPAAAPKAPGRTDWGIY